MSKLKETQKQGYKTLVAIAVIGIAVYLGFEPLIKFVPDGVAKSVISSSFGAIFVIILTMYLLNKQTEIEQETKILKFLAACGKSKSIHSIKS